LFDIYGDMTLAQRRGNFAHFVNIISSITTAERVLPAGITGYAAATAGLKLSKDAEKLMREVEEVVKEFAPKD
jgi:hypothetical protein